MAAEQGAPVQFATGAIPAPEQAFAPQSASPTEAAYDAPMPAAPKFGKHVVKKGDTLWAIARRNGISLKALIAANPQIANPNMIFPGQVVKLPGKGKAPATPVGEVVGGDSSIEVSETSDGHQNEQGDHDAIDFGDHGSQVAEVQLLLKRTGYYQGNVGGNFGPGTRDALKRFQADRGVPVP